MLKFFPLNSTSRLSLDPRFFLTPLLHLKRGSGILPQGRPRARRCDIMKQVWRIGGAVRATGQGREAAADAWRSGFFFAPGAGMNSSWQEFTKQVKKLKRPNVFEREISKLRFSGTRRCDFAALQSRHELVEFSRREQRNFRSEAKIDLHGATRNEIDKLLRNFCEQSIMYNFNKIIIVTGKGRGILRDEVMCWLRANTQFVLKYFAIKDARNSSGAIGVLLRRLR